MVSILVADDHGIVREGLKRVLESEPDLRVCAEASDGSEVLEQVEKHRPDVVLLDITMPKLGGLEALEQLRGKRPELRVILLSMHGDRSFIQSAVSLGADGYLLKNAPPEEVISAVRAVAEGGSFFSPPVAREIVDQLRASTRVSPKDPFALLSVREREVLLRIADGLSAKEIARELDISTKTVEAHRTSLMRKLGTRKATALVRYALRHGLVKP
jgi:DNA-binding NarL/FixJ family response regulator